MDHPLGNLLEDHRDRVVTALNVLVEAPYFYREDDEETFFFLRRHRRQFAAFLEQSFGWRLVLDDRCARVLKEKWHNPAISESQRDIFRFSRRDECLAFMMMLEFFEHQLDENSMTVEDREPLKFRLGDLLSFLVRRFAELFPEKAETSYTEESVRKTILREVLPVLTRYRFLRLLPPPKELGRLDDTEHIYEALPAMYHYNTNALAHWSDPAAPPGLDAEEGDES
jgi:hypothetical protein